MLSCKVVEMHICQAPYRELCDSIHNYQGTNLYCEVLYPWLENAVSIKAWLSDFATRNGSPIPEASYEDLFELYALSRVNELLILRFQPGQSARFSWLGPEITIKQYIEFMQCLGFDPVTATEFSPFDCEIVEVIQDKQPNAKISIVKTLWPGLMLGKMMFSRSGTCVTGGDININKFIAETSTLYWAYQRKNRPYQDLSHGWGSNSQWRTRFRRDYRIGNLLYYNVDGEKNLNLAEDNSEDDDSLELHERLELLKHRCFITVNKPDDDLFPYCDSYCEAAS